MTDSCALTASQISSLSEVDAADWNRLAGDDPLLKHEFLYAMERSGSVGADTAWEPSHLLLHDDDSVLRAAMPLYLKHDSRGEFVFDWSWADAYDRAGLPYYPKLVSAVPFTPATGTRLLVDPSTDATAAGKALVAHAVSFAGEADLSSLHVLFPSDTERARFAEAGLLERKGCQFQWRNDGYRDFGDFLSRFNSAKRKKVKRERRRIAEAGITFDQLPGDALTDAEWDAVFEFYAHTFYRRGRSPYLNREFFDILSRSMPENVLVILARYNGQPIATAICYCGGGALYGRYWGSAADFHSLHFETCYYQGIEYCIEHGLERFEPGTQGEHKISRGFSPTPTWSFHWLREPAFYDAIADYLMRETSHVDSYIDFWDDHLPYRQDAFSQDRGA